MTESICTSCGTLIPKQATTCPNCKAPIKQSSVSTANTHKVDIFMAINGKKFPDVQLPFIREKLIECDSEKLSQINKIQFKNPKTIRNISIFLGWIGVDRFMIGNIGAGICKIFTCGGCYVWWLIDIFLIQEKTRKYNYAKLLEHL